MKHKNNTVIGAKGEDLAVTFLKENSYKIIERNFHSSRGELDIVALDDDELVFLEVKTRVKDLESALASMTYSKCRKIMQTAEYFLLKHPEFEDSFTRFDLIAVLFQGEEPVIHHIKEAISF